MSILADVFNKYNAVNKHIEYFGAEPKVIVILEKLFKNIGQTIMDENGVNSKEAASLPIDTVLGKKAEEAFKKYCEYIGSIS